MCQNNFVPQKVLLFIILAFFVVEVLEPSDNFVRAYEPNLCEEALSDISIHKPVQSLWKDDFSLAFLTAPKTQKKNSNKKVPATHRSTGALTFTVFKPNKIIFIQLNKKAVALQFEFPFLIYRPPIIS